MNKNSIIKIVVIVVCFGGSGLVLYFGLFSSKAPQAPPGMIQNSFGPMTQNLGQQSLPGAIVGQDILPNGTTLDFDKVINPKRFEYNVIPYPQLDPGREVGIPESMLMYQPLTSP